MAMKFIIVSIIFWFQPIHHLSFVLHDQ
jgi:beta-lactamase regulating signal transducer with metallopeptidase domain